MTEPAVSIIGIESLPEGYQPSIQFTSRRRKTPKPRRPTTDRPNTRAKQRQTIVNLDDNDEERLDGSCLVGQVSTARPIIRTAPGIMSRRTTVEVAEPQPPPKALVKKTRRNEPIPVPVAVSVSTNRRKQTMQPQMNTTDYVTARVAEADGTRAPPRQRGSSFGGCLPGGRVALVRFAPYFNRDAVTSLTGSARAMVRQVHSRVSSDYGTCLAEQSIEEATSALCGVRLDVVVDAVNFNKGVDVGDAPSTSTTVVANLTNQHGSAANQHRSMEKSTADDTTRTIMYSVYRNLLATANKTHPNVRRIDLVDIVAQLTHSRQGTIYRMLRSAREQWLHFHVHATLTLTKQTAALFLPGARAFQFVAIPKSAHLAAIQKRALTSSTSRGSTSVSEREKFGVDRRKLENLRRAYGYTVRMRPNWTPKQIVWAVCRRTGMSLMQADTLRSIVMPSSDAQRFVTILPRF